MTRIPAPVTDTALWSAIRAHALAITGGPFELRQVRLHMYEVVSEEGSLRPLGRVWYLRGTNGSIEIHSEKGTS